MTSKKTLEEAFNEQRRIIQERDGVISGLMDDFASHEKTIKEKDKEIERLKHDSTHVILELKERFGAITKEKDIAWKAKIQEIIDINGEWINADEFSKILKEG